MAGGHGEGGSGEGFADGEAVGMGREVGVQMVFQLGAGGIVDLEFSTWHDGGV